jgi:hypothetical protein
MSITITKAELEATVKAAVKAALAEAESNAAAKAKAEANAKAAEADKYCRGCGKVWQQRYYSRCNHCKGNCDYCWGDDNGLCYA